MTDHKKLTKIQIDVAITREKISSIEVDVVRVTLTGTPDDFDAGAVNILVF